MFGISSQRSPLPHTVKVISVTVEGWREVFIEGEVSHDWDFVDIISR